MGSHLQSLPDWWTFHEYWSDCTKPGLRYKYSSNMIWRLHALQKLAEVHLGKPDTTDHQTLTIYLWGDGPDSCRGLPPSYGMWPVFHQASQTPVLTCYSILYFFVGYDFLWARWNKACETVAFILDTIWPVHSIPPSCYSMLPWHIFCYTLVLPDTVAQILKCHAGEILRQLQCWETQDNSLIQGGFQIQ